MEFNEELETDCSFDIDRSKGYCLPDDVILKINQILLNSKKINSNNYFIDDLSDNDNDNDNIDRSELIDIRELIDKIKKENKCDTEICILKKSKIKNMLGYDEVNDLLQKYFKPMGPKFSNEWLSNVEIDVALSQFRKKFKEKHFFHIPFQMRDFEKKNTELARLNWEQEYAYGYRTFGTIINTDYSNGQGIHWFAIFGDFLDNSEEFTIEYFNSSGELPLIEISVWMKKMERLLNFKKNIKSIVVTRIKNQKDSSSCGVYSLYYIYLRLNNIPYKWVSENVIGDKKMKLFRQALFILPDD